MTRSQKAARAAVALLVAVLAAILVASANGAGQQPRRPAAALGALERGILADLNALRRRHGLSALHLSVQLGKAASQHSHEMAADGYFAHASVDGGVFWKRIQVFYPRTNRGLWSVGENLLWSSPGVSSSQALTLWENSPEHRVNLLMARWREVGISAVRATDAPGAFHGLDVTIVTTDFGVRR